MAQYPPTEQSCCLEDSIWATLGKEMRECMCVKWTMALGSLSDIQPCCMYWVSKTHYRKLQAVSSYTCKGICLQFFSLCLPIKLVCILVRVLPIGFFQFNLHSEAPVPMLSLLIPITLSKQSSLYICNIAIKSSLFPFYYHRCSDNLTASCQLQPLCILAAYSWETSYC